MMPPARQRGLDALDRVDDVGAGLLEDEQQHAALAVLPAGELAVLRSVDRMCRCRACASARHCGTPPPRCCIRGPGDLVVGINRVGFVRAVDAALGLSTVALTRTLRTSSIVIPIEASFAGSTCTRTAGFCWPPISTCADARRFARSAGRARFQRSHPRSVSGSASDCAARIMIGASDGFTFR